MRVIVLRLEGQCCWVVRFSSFVFRHSFFVIRFLSFVFCQKIDLEPRNLFLTLLPSYPLTLLPSYPLALKTTPPPPARAMP
jgi:hypothetical protein